MNKKIATLGVTLGLAAGGAAGFALGQPGVSNAVSSGTTAAVATATSGTGTTGTTADSQRPDPTARLTEVLSPLVTDGTLTQAQLDAVIAKLAAAGPMGGGHHGGPRGGLGLDAAATALGVTADELRTELEAGTTIAQVATDKGVDLATVTAAMVKDATDRINARVTDGSLTQAEADTKIAALSDRITQLVNNPMPAGGHGPGGRGHGDDDAPADTAAPTTTVG